MMRGAARLLRYFNMEAAAAGGGGLGGRVSPRGWMGPGDRYGVVDLLSKPGSQASNKRTYTYTTGQVPYCTEIYGRLHLAGTEVQWCRVGGWGGGWTG